MRLAVIGAGVVGVTTAYELTEDGHEVVVFERHSTAAEGASFANGGLVAPEWIAAQAGAQWRSDLGGAQSEQQRHLDTPTPQRACSTWPDTATIDCSRSPSDISWHWTAIKA